MLLDGFFYFDRAPGEELQLASGQLRAGLARQSDEHAALLHLSEIDCHPHDELPIGVAAEPAQALTRNIERHAFRHLVLHAAKYRSDAFGTRGSFDHRVDVRRKVSKRSSRRKTPAETAAKIKGPRGIG